MSADPLLRVEGVCKTIGGVSILAGVNLNLEKGRTLGLVGLSGSGKSTLARCIALFDTPTQGQILLGGRPAQRSQVQLILQEAAASLNPRFTAADAVAEPLAIQKRGDRRSRRESAIRWMEFVGLSADAAGKRTMSFSGGERQRLAIARALVLEPQLLILDESLSGLDLSLQAQIANLLLDLQRRLDLTCILISHDLTLAGRIAGEIAVMDGGAIVEHAPTADVLRAPRHPRTRELVAASLALAI